jgi:hypothetical protein
MSHDEPDENRREDPDRLAHAAQVEVDQHDDDGDRDLQLDDLMCRRQQAEERIHAARDRDGDRQNVIDDQRRPRNESRVRPYETGSDLVSAAAVRKQLDDLVVCERDHEHREGRGDRQIERKGAVCAERHVRLGRAIGRRRETVGADPDPSEESGESDVLSRLRRHRVPRGPEDCVAPTTLFGCGHASLTPGDVAPGPDLVRAVP